MRGNPQQTQSPVWGNVYGSHQSPGGAQNGQINNNRAKPNLNSNWPNNPNNKWPVHGSSRNGPSNAYQGAASNKYNSRFFGSSGLANQLFGSNVDSQLSQSSGNGADCSPETYKNYVLSCLHNNGSSLLENDMSFPVKQEQVKKSCSLWSSFFICIRKKIQGCTNHKQFTEGLKDPISSLQKMCTDEEFQLKYLMQAQCMKTVIDTYCPTSYDNLIARVKTEDTAIINYCCDGLVLKQCAMAPLKQQCSSLAGEILVSNLHFLSKCGQYRPQLPCPPVKVPDGPPDPRSNNFGDSRTNNANRNSNSNINNANNNNPQDSRIGNGRLVEATTRKPVWRKATTPYWPINPQPAQHKDQKSASGRTTPHSLFVVSLVFFMTGFHNIRS